MEEVDLLEKDEGGDILVSGFSYGQEKPWISSVGDRQG